MNLLNRLTIKNLKLNQKRTIVTIIGIILSIAMLTAVASMFFSARASLIAYQIDQKGNYHYGFQDVPIEEIKTFELHRKIEQFTTIENLGYAKLDGIQNEYKPYVYVKGFSENGFEMMSVKLVEGRLPKNQQEIVVSEHLESNGGVAYQVGDKIALELGTRMSEGHELVQGNPFSPEVSEEIVNTKTQEYEVVGIIERLPMHLEPYSAPGYTMLTCSEKGTLSDKAESGNLDVYLRYQKQDLKHHMEITADILGVDKKTFELYSTGEFYMLGEKEQQAIMEEVENGKYQYGENRNLLMLETGIIQDGTLQFLAGAALIVAAIIIFTSVYCIKNSFDISITEKIRQYGMLSSIGATKKQIKRNVYHEAFVLGIIGLPVGMLSGIFASYVLLEISDYLLGNSVSFKLKFAFSWLTIIFSVLLGVLTIFLSARSSAVKASKIMPIQAIRNSAEIKIKAKQVKTPRWVGKLFGIGGEISYKNLQRSKKKYRTTVISIVICVMVFISVSSFVDFAYKTVRVNYTTHNYNIVVYLGPMGMAESKLNEVREIESVEQAVKNVGTHIRFTTDRYTKEYIAYCREQGMYPLSEDQETIEVEDSLSVRVIDQKSYKAYVKELGLDFEEVEGKGILVNRIFTTHITEEGQEKQIEMDTYTFQSGDVITGEVVRSVDEEGKEIKESVEIEIAALATKVPMGCQEFPSWNYMIVGEELGEKLLSEQYHGSIFIQSNDANETQKELETILGSGIEDIFNYEAQVEQEHSLFLLIAIFLYGFITVIALIGVTNIFNTIITNMNLRRREFAMLKSVGMTRKEFNRMIQLESFFYGTKSLLIGIPLGCALSYFIYYVMMSGMISITYELPWKAILISVVTVFVLVGVIMRYSIGKIEKQNIIETIRNENI